MKNYSIIGIILFLLMSTSAFAYDTEINGLRYDWVSYYNASKTSGDVKLVGYSSSYLGESLTIPCSVKWNEKKKGTEGRNCQVCRVESNAFENCTILKSVDFGCVQDVNSNAFKNCISLQTIYFSNTIISILPLSFSGCTSITEIHIDKNTPPNIYDENAFDEVIYNNCIVFVPEGSVNVYKNADIWKKFANITDGKLNTYTLSISATGNGTVSYGGTAIRGETSSYTIDEGANAIISFAPDDGYRVKSIKVNNTDVTSSISNNSYTVSNVNNDITIEVVFEAIPLATEFEVDGVTYKIIPNTDNVKVMGKINTYTGFIVIPETVSYQSISYTVIGIDDDAFYGETNITSVVIPKTIEYIHESAFGNCTNLDKVYISSLESWLNIDFENSTSNPLNCAKHLYVNDVEINDLVIPEGLEYLMDFAFAGFAGLRSVVLPSTLKILDRSFGGCSNLQLVTSKANKPAYVEDKMWRPFSGIAADAKLIVPKGSKDAYLDVPAWSSNFKEIVEEKSSYTLTITITGNGFALYDGTNIRSTTKSFTVDEGTSVTIKFTPDDRYRIKNVKVNNTDVTSSISNNSYTISNISSDTTVEVEFEAIPPTTYTLSIKATGNGFASYDGTAIRGKTSSFTVTEGTSATILFSPDDGYRIKSVTVNNADVTSSVSNNSYTVSNISGDMTVEVEFEAIPPTTYTLSIAATGNGTVTYDNTDVRGKTSSFTVIKGTSATITFDPDDGYRIKSVMVNNSDVTTRVSNDSYTISSISSDVTIEVEFEAIPPTTYTLSIKATGNGSATYDGTAVRDKTSTFTIIEGMSAAISFSPDDGYRIKSVKVNSTDVTSSVSNGSYTISSISGDTTVEVEFEAIPPTIYTLSIKATGNGSASYDGTTIREKTSTFTVVEGTNATISFSSDNGYRIKNVKVNNSDVTSSVANGSYTVGNISRNTTVEVEFEAIPTTTYTLSIKATGNGSASYEGTPIKNSTNTFTVNEGANATITFTPDNGYRIKNVKVNSTDVTSSVSSNTYTVSNIRGNTAVEVEFEIIPPTIYTLSIKATGNGDASYDGTAVRGKTNTYNVEGGTSATITFSPDNGNRIKSVKVNSADVTSQVMNNSYTISNISGNTSVEVEFEEIISELTYGGIYYKVESEAQQTIKVVSGDYGLSLEVPASFTAKNKEWKVVGIEADVLNNAELAAIIWNPDVAFSGKVNNPNLLLYVKDKKYAPEDIKNVVVNGEAENIELIDAENGNNFYCPQTFKAKRISYVHRYSMKTGFKTCQGWETIVLPFDVATILSATGTEIVPYSAWQQGSNSRPFWLYSMNSDGWKAESSIKANVPYIISMPNNKEYEASYNLSGDIQFTSSNVQVLPSDNLPASKCGNKQLVPNYQNKVASQDIYALNVNSQWNTNTATETEGSAFIRSLRQVRPFEAYMAIEGNAGARRVIPVFEDEATGIPSIPVLWGSKDDAIYNLNGQRVNSMSRGVYIQNGKKIVKK